MSNITTPVAIIEPTTAFVATVFYAIEKSMLPVTIFATNLTGLESVQLRVSNDGGVTSPRLRMGAGDIDLNTTNNSMTVDYPILLGFTKSGTVSAGGVYIMSTQTV
jgi:hypothetical protein